MCTAMSWNGLFGRTLDLERACAEEVVMVPRNLPLPFRAGRGEEGYAVLGMARVEGGVPLYFDAFNEKGLAMAALNFPGYALWRETEAGRDNVPSFEVIPWVLRQCASVEEAKGCLERMNITGEAFSPHLPPTPLHWMVSDGRENLVVEQTEEGLRVYDDPAGVLTNSPPFPTQLLRLADLMHLSPAPPQNRLVPEVQLSRYSRGMGATGLPGDWSSSSRFVRAAFLRSHGGMGEGSRVSAFFLLMEAVAVPEGCVRLENGLTMVTRYTSCCDLSRGLYCYTTGKNRRICAVSLHREDLNGTGLRRWPLAEDVEIHLQN